MKKVLTLVLLVAVGFCSFAQVGSKKNTLTDINNFSTVLLQNYAPNVDSINNRCWEGCVFIRFSISNDHKFTKTAYTASTPVFIKVALDNAFKTMNEKQALKTLTSFSKTPYIFPLQIIYNEGCGSQTGFTGFGDSTRLAGQLGKMYKERQSNFYRSDQSIWDITNFTDGRLDLINCTLLTPTRIGGQMF